MKRIIFIILVILLSVFSRSYASIEISTDHRSLFFGLMQLGQEKELAQSGTYHNQVTCSSTNGNTWYLKISLLHRLSSAEETIPLEYFKWQLVWTNGSGTVVNPYQFKTFSLIPDLVYISGSGESGGSLVNLQFKYSLKVPDTQLSGTYNTTIRFTLTEAL